MWPLRPRQRRRRRVQRQSCKRSRRRRRRWKKRGCGCRHRRRRRRRRSATAHPWRRRRLWQPHLPRRRRARVWRPRIWSRTRYARTRSRGKARRTRRRIGSSRPRVLGSSAPSSASLMVTEACRRPSIASSTCRATCCVATSSARAGGTRWTCASSSRRWTSPSLLPTASCSRWRGVRSIPTARRRCSSWWSARRSIPSPSSSHTWAIVAPCSAETASRCGSRRTTAPTARTSRNVSRRRGAASSR
mmetsp:Transcript_36867/g.86126  ORF Transcript_36867/g.86126 Transcript_36867/m.86126 type:complete len:246 (+) Transcript_36867:621-1358(+)